MTIEFGPSGIGGVKESPNKLQNYKENGIKAAEIPFTYQVWIKDKESANKIKYAAEKAGVKLSIHAHYWVNLNSVDDEKIKRSKERILKCCKIASWLNIKRVIFHCGYYGKRDKEESYNNIKNAILDIQSKIKEKKYNVKLYPEISGKKNVFGSIKEISNLAKDTNCKFCIDFAHVLARYGDYKIKELKEKFPQKKWHCHFSGIEYNQKGEKKHILTPKKELEKLLSKLPKNKKIRIINESPSPVQDSILSIRVHKSK